LGVLTALFGQFGKMRAAKHEQSNCSNKKTKSLLIFTLVYRASNNGNFWFFVAVSLTNLS